MLGEPPSSARRGHLEERSKSTGMKLRYDLDVIGRHVNQVVHDLAWVGRLHTVLTAVDPQMPGPLQQALLDVADLASEQGHEIAVGLAGKPQLGLFEARPAV